MRIILLLCAAFALSIAAEPEEEVAAAQERHIDEERLPVEEVGGKMLGDVKQVSCPPGWSKYGSRCFIFFHIEMSWVDAEKYCLGKLANLVSIHNAGEHQFIQEIVRGSTGRFPQAWIGGHDAVKDFVWLWSDGSGFYFQDWSQGEPDNKGENEKCLAMNQPADFRWGDVNCEQRLPFVCGTRQA